MAHPTWAPNRFFKITPGVTDLPNGICRALVADAAGTIDGIDGDGNTCTGFPVVPGQNPGHWKRITATSVTNLWAAYN